MKIDSIEKMTSISKVGAKTASNTCFVIMSFSTNPRLMDFYELAIKPTVSDMGFDCERMDEKEFNGKISEAIIESIKSSRFVIFDATEARPNCYYELGIAHALGKDVIHISNSIDNIHFDIRDFNFIIYSRIDELSSRLSKRISNTI